MSNGYVDHIDHKAVVESTDPKAGTVTLRIVDDAEDCGQCPAARLCAAGRGERTLTLHRSDAVRFSKGQQVTLRGSERLHRKAIMLCTVLPCIALVAVMTAIFLLTANQMAAAAGGLGATVFFFLLIWLMRDRIAHEFEFEITQTD